MKIRAPAKINLRLRIVGRRADGYHLLDTIIVPVSLYDEIEIRRLSRRVGRGTHAPITVRCDQPDIPLGNENIAYRAAELIIRAGGVTEPVAISIKKRIPVGAGLGGGSSDAAATLLGMNRLFRLSLSTRQLQRMAVTLGADVPFFVRCLPARARGIGEVLEPLSVLPHFWAVIVYPGFPVETAWVYGKLRQKLTKNDVNTSMPNSPKTFGELTWLLENDLEGVTLKHYPKIAVLKEKLLRAGAPRVLMSGSGSAVFGIFASRKAASSVFNQLRQEEGAQAFLVHALR